MHDWNSTLILSARHSCMQSGKCIVVQQRPLQSSRGKKKNQKTTLHSYNVKITTVWHSGTLWSEFEFRLPLQHKCVQAFKNMF